MLSHSTRRRRRRAGDKTLPNEQHVFYRIGLDRYLLKATALELCIIAYKTPVTSAYSRSMKNTFDSWHGPSWWHILSWDHMVKGI
jgi:hypothetical protein